jgi:hypothetical protein
VLAQTGVVDESLLVQMKRAVGARANAVTGSNTAFFKVDHFRLGSLTLGIMTPPTV